MNRSTVANRDSEFGLFDRAWLGEAEGPGLQAAVNGGVVKQICEDLL
jgi:hypothetical protein